MGGGDVKAGDYIDQALAAALNAGAQFAEFKAVNLGDVEAAARAEQDRWRTQIVDLRQKMQERAAHFAEDAKDGSEDYGHSCGLHNAIHMLEEAMKGFSR